MEHQQERGSKNDTAKRLLGHAAHFQFHVSAAPRGRAMVNHRKSAIDQTSTENLPDRANCCEGDGTKEPRPNDVRLSLE